MELAARQTPQDRVRLRVLESPPQTRADCLDGATTSVAKRNAGEACPHVRCRHHLHADMIGRGRHGAKRRTLHVVAHSKFSCALDIADANPGGLTFSEIGMVMGMHGERARQIYQEAQQRIDPDFKWLPHENRAQHQMRKNLHVRLREKEMDLIEQRARALGVTVAKFVRMAIERFR